MVWNFLILLLSGRRALVFLVHPSFQVVFSKSRERIDS